MSQVPPDPTLTETQCDELFALGGNVGGIAVDPAVPGTITTGPELFAWWSGLFGLYQAQVQAAIYEYLRSLIG